MKYNNYVTPISFRVKIDQLLSNRYISPNINESELRQLSQYFSPFVHADASNEVTSDPDQIQRCVNAILNTNDSIIEKYRFKGAKSPNTINLEKNNSSGNN